MSMVLVEHPYPNTRSVRYVHGATMRGAMEQPQNVSRYVRNCGLKAAAIAWLVGTGGALTPGAVVARDGIGYPLSEFSYESPSPVAKRIKIRSSAESLAQVRAKLNPTVTELAALLGVSRQTIYNWQSGQPIAEQNGICLQQLAIAADVLEGKGVSGASGLLRRKLPGGKTLLESIRDGAPGRATAEVMVSMLSRESGQRQVIGQRLAGRPNKALDTVYVGAPHYPEQV